MKATGIVRHIDPLGRIVIPKEIRRKLGMNEGDPVDIFTHDDTVVLVKYNPGCVFCGDCGSVRMFKGRLVCDTCMSEMSSRAVKNAT